VWYKNIAGRFFGLVTKHVCDRQMGGQNYDSQDRAGIAASHGNKVSNVKLCSHVLSCWIVRNVGPWDKSIRLRWRWLLSASWDVC